MNKVLVTIIVVFGAAGIFLYFHMLSKPSASVDQEIERLRIQNAALEQQIKSLNKLVIQNKQMLKKVDGGVQEPTEQSVSVIDAQQSETQDSSEAGVSGSKPVPAP